MKVELHQSTVKHLIPLCDELGLTPSQVIKMLTKAYNNHINRGQTLDLQGVTYDAREEDKEAKYPVQD